MSGPLLGAKIVKGTLATRSSYRLAAAWLLVASGCGRYGYDVLGEDTPGGDGGPAPTCALLETFDDYAAITDAAFTERWQVGALEPGSAVQLQEGELWLDDVNAAGGTGGITVTSRGRFTGDCDVRVRVRGETQCSGFAQRGYAVILFLLRDADDPDRFLGWEMPWDCAISGDPPQRIFSHLGNHWTSPERDQEPHWIELRRRASLVQVLVDDVERFAAAEPYGDFRIELGGYSAATFDHPAGIYYDEVVAEAP